MKNSLCIILLLAALPGFSQKKKSSTPDPKDAKIDSLSAVSLSLSVERDSLSKERDLYYGVYAAIKDKVVLHEFDPAQMPQLIDSLRTNKDATINGLMEASTSLQDSLANLTKENMELKEKLSELSTGGDKTSLITELKQLKELLDAKIITQAEYDDKKKIVMDKWQ